MRKIRLTQSAQRDIESIWEYTFSEWGAEQAEKYIALIEKGLCQLLDNPDLGKVRPDINQNYRALQVQKHLIFYSQTGNTINVLGIPHARMDAKLHML